jgi:hypothetical protein
LKSLERKAFLVFASTVLLAFALTILASPVGAGETLWSGVVFSDGVEVVSPALQAGILYRITASEGAWWYDYPDNLAADAQYYTTDPSNSIYWGNYFPAPGGASFLQINGQNVTWGPYSGGDTNHTYRIFYTGTGASLTFRIVDWMDQNYANNVCHINVVIHSMIPVGGYVVDPSPWSIVTYFLISALVFTAVITVPIVKCRRKTLERND